MQKDTSKHTHVDAQTHANPRTHLQFRHTLTQKYRDMHGSIDTYRHIDTRADHTQTHAQTHRHAHPSPLHMKTCKHTDTHTYRHPTHTHQDTPGPPTARRRGPSSTRLLWSSGIASPPPPHTGGAGKGRLWTLRALWTLASLETSSRSSGHAPWQQRGVETPESGCSVFLTMAQLGGWAIPFHFLSLRFLTCRRGRELLG